MAAAEEHDEALKETAEDVDDVVEAFDEAGEDKGDAVAAADAADGLTIDNLVDCLLEPKLRRIDCRLWRRNDSRLMLPPAPPLRRLAGTGVGSNEMGSS